MSKFANTTMKITDDRAAVIIHWDEKHQSRCSVKWLRFHCQCNRCKRTMPVVYPVIRASFDDDIKVENVDVSGDELLCKIDKEIFQDHITKIPLQYLLSNCNCDACIEAEIERREMKPLSTKSTLPAVTYGEVGGPEGLFRCLKNIIDYGFCIIKGFPTDRKIMNEFVTSIGPMRSTFYGYDFDVVNTENAINGAYTNLALPFHQDLPAYEMAPGVQILLAKRFEESVKGGDSKLADVVECANILRNKHPDCFETLCRIPARFETKDMEREQPAWYEHTKTHIELDYFGKISAVNWSPGVEGALRIREKDVDSYYQAHKVFYNIINNEENQFIFRLHTGDMLIFNNHRMVHSRGEFQTEKSGDRHLMGCYINLDDLKSKYMVLGHQLGMELTSPKVCNRSSF